MKPYRKVITVRGALAFPVDMLRYDRAFPRTELDSLKIQASIESSGTAGTQEIELLSDDMPTRDRWQSFGYNILRVERLA